MLEAVQIFEAMEWVQPLFKSPESLGNIHTVLKFYSVKHLSLSTKRSTLYTNAGLPIPVTPKISVESLKVTAPQLLTPTFLCSRQSFMRQVYKYISQRPDFSIVLSGPDFFWPASMLVELTIQHIVKKAGA